MMSDYYISGIKKNIERAFIGRGTGNSENVVDGLFAIADGLHAVAKAIENDSEKKSQKKVELLEEVLDRKNDVYDRLLADYLALKERCDG